MNKSDFFGVTSQEIDRKLQITSRLALGFQDYRKPNKTLHPIESLLAQRIYGLIMGYEDLNDHEELRHDPMFGLALGKRIDQENEPLTLAGKSTLLLKLGALITVSTRRVLIAINSSCPYKHICS
ncbi:transposase [Dolichospermum circinale CS-1225]|uniref:Transposase n=1 Tax=Dolichospermum circinale CS-537/01 TaxID=3021739 RepID=A0ABT5A733_9CYAN|nr:transposase [Dolichospermum circinale]MDB9465270.1 transposase [Dolichospermum circinale CS-539/09]MDB9472734.1 transposase [Dolichospermum circinale CS-539]MDB9487273.1 transposase [Dolichospermum circinale CS-537/01]MDB9521897.1 transposase [Dolichospermum circinale CS-1225]